MFLAKPLRFRVDLVCVRSLRGRRRSSERRFFCALAILRVEQAGRRAPAGGPPLGTRPSACAAPARMSSMRTAPARGHVHAAPDVRPLARESRRATPIREPRRANSLRVLCPCRSRSARKAHAGQLARRAHAGRLMRTAQAGPRVPRPCEPACVRGRSPGKMLRRCALEHSAMAIYRLDAFSSVRLWR